MSSIIEEPIRALSWKQPYASLMLFGKIETRTWNTNYRGLVLICASKQEYTPESILNISGALQSARIKSVLSTNKIDLSSTLGYAIAVGRLVDCRPMTKQDEDKCFVDFYHPLYCHIYQDVKAIEPIPFKGQQGWATVKPDVLQKIKFI